MTDYAKATIKLRETIKDRSKTLQRLFHEQMSDAKKYLEQAETFADEDWKQAHNYLDHAMECINNCSVMLRIKTPGPEAIKYIKAQIVANMKEDKP